MDSQQAPQPTPLEDVKTANGIIKSLRIKGKQLLLSGELLKVAATPHFSLSEEQVLKTLYGGRGIDDVNKNSLRSLINALNERLSRVPGSGLNIECRTMGGGSNRSLYMHVEHLKEKKAPDADVRHESMKKLSFRWSGPKIAQRSRTVWLPVHGADIDVAYRIESAEWIAPQGFAGYSVHREQCWNDYLKSYPNCPNPRIWHVMAANPKRDHGATFKPSIELIITPIYFKDVVATTFCLGSNIDADDGKLSIQEWLDRNAPHCLAHQHFSPAGNPLLVEVNVITRDNKLLLREHCDLHKRETRFEATVFGYVDSICDGHRTALHIPDPSETFLRKCCQLLRHALPPGSVRWLGVGLGLREGKVSILGEVVVPVDADEFMGSINSREKLRALELRPEVIHRFCADNKLRAHVEAAMVLSLKGRNPKVTLGTAIAKPNAGPTK